MKVVCFIVGGIILAGFVSLWLISQEVGSFIDDVKGDDSDADWE